MKDKKHIVRKATTPEAQALWKVVKEEGEKSPEWTKPIVERIAKRDVERLLRR